MIESGDMGRGGALCSEPATQCDRGRHHETSAGAEGAKDLVARGVISIRSGGRNRQQEVWLSDLRKTAQTPPYAFKNPYCLFCRVVV